MSEIDFFFKAEPNLFKNTADAAPLAPGSQVEGVPDVLGETGESPGVP